jgi:cell division protein FtsB
VNDVEAQAMRRENDYLKRRCAQLESDVTDLTSQVLRLQQERERMGAARARSAANPLSGGQ